MSGFDGHAVAARLLVACETSATSEEAHAAFLASLLELDFNDADLVVASQSFSRLVEAVVSSQGYGPGRN